MSDDTFERRLALLSDQDLAKLAQQLVTEHAPPSTTQLHALRVFGQDWDQLKKFAIKQQQRPWDGNRVHYGEFFGALSRQLAVLERLATIEWFPDRASRAERPRMLARIGQEFAQHLYAEALYHPSVPPPQPQDHPPTAPDARRGRVQAREPVGGKAPGRRELRGPCSGGARER